MASRIEGREISFRRIRHGFTLVELLVVLAIFAVLVALPLPAVQSAREAARRGQCASHLKQLGVAIASYESTYQVLPPGTIHKIAMLPELGYGSLMDLKNESAASVEEAFARISEAKIPILVCPTDSAPVLSGDSPAVASTNYLACGGSGVLKFGLNGMFGYGELSNQDVFPDPAYIRYSDVSDGLSHTVAMSEILRSNDSQHRLRVNWALPDDYLLVTEFSALLNACSELPSNPGEYGYFGAPSRGRPWYSGGFGVALYNHSLPPNYPSCMNGTAYLTGVYTATSQHGGGANSLYGDGRVEFVSESIDAKLWQDLGSRTQQVLSLPAISTP